jgi:hypothetical protein
MRLLTSGCSYTDYSWSTWADYLGKEFASYTNVGIAGNDNATIARSVVANACAGDIVVVLWSGFDRWSKYTDKEVPWYKQGKQYDFRWNHVGSVKVDKTFMVKYYHRIERFQTTMDYVQLVDLHSQVVGYTAYHFSAFPFLMGEIEKTIDPEILNIYKKYHIANNYLNEISMFDYQIQYHPHIQYPSDLHPTPLTHWEYCNKVIAPKLNLTLTTNIDEVMAEQHELIVNGMARKMTQ